MRLVVMGGAVGLGFGLAIMAGAAFGAGETAKGVATLPFIALCFVIGFLCDREEPGSIQPMEPERRKFTVRQRSKPEQVRVVETAE